jgi:hypothetical protein
MYFDRVTGTFPPCFIKPRPRRVSHCQQSSYIFTKEVRKRRKHKRTYIQASSTTLLIHREALILFPEGQIRNYKISTSLYITECSREENTATVIV